MPESSSTNGLDRTNHHSPSNPRSAKGKTPPATSPLPGVRGPTGSRSPPRCSPPPSDLRGCSSAFDFFTGQLCLLGARRPPRLTSVSPDKPANLQTIGHSDTRADLRPVAPRNDTQCLSRGSPAWHRPERPERSSAAHLHASSCRVDRGEWSRRESQASRESNQRRTAKTPKSCCRPNGS